MESLSFDVLVIGAGAAGSISALEIASRGYSVAIIEAKERIGGRIFTIHGESEIIEMGAEFVHGNLPLTQQLLKEAGAKLSSIEGSILQYKNGQLEEMKDFINDFDDLEKKFECLLSDKPVAGFLREDLKDEKYRDLRQSLENYVEGYYAADTSKASAIALREELTKGQEEQYRIAGGYKLLIDYLEQQCRQKGVQFFLSQPVSQLHWKRGEAVVKTEKVNYKTKKVLLTIPVGVLQKETITFYPSLPKIKEAVQCLGFGHVIKIVMQFDAAFWKDSSLTKKKSLPEFSFLFSNEMIPTWWTHHPHDDTILVGWLGGPKAEAMQFFTIEDITAKAITSLSKIFNIDALTLKQKLVKSHFYNWSADPHFCGAYSYEVVNNGEYIRRMQQPIEGTLFFAGEGLHRGPEIGTVEGALVSGRDAANRLINSFTA
jgi:monoamine oxidase